jgi:hypothetical protein
VHFVKFPRSDDVADCAAIAHTRRRQSSAAAPAEWTATPRLTRSRRRRRHPICFSRSEKLPGPFVAH